MHSLRAQKGMTAIGWLLTLALIGFFTLIVLRLAPVYMDYYEIAASLDSLQQVPEVTQKSPAEIRDLLQRRFDMNNIDSPSAKNVKITEANGVLNVVLDYEVRRHFAGNVDLVVNFNKVVKVIGH
ncbi:MAG: DUF4845 domain-containing protein [Gammaproteobacteria bacterium]